MNAPAHSLPCPFCGSKDIVEFSGWVSCNDCGCHGPDVSENPGGLSGLDLWNRRVLGRSEYLTTPAPSPTACNCLATNNPDPHAHALTCPVFLESELI